MGENGNGGRVSLTRDDLIKYAMLLLALGAGVARFEFKFTQVEDRLSAIEYELRDQRGPRNGVRKGVRTGSGVVEASPQGDL